MLLSAPVAFGAIALELLGFYYFPWILIQPSDLNVQICYSLNTRVLLITQLIFFLPYLLLIQGWNHYRLDTAGPRRGMPLFKEEHETEIPRVIDDFVTTSSTFFGASLGNVKDASPPQR